MVERPFPSQLDSPGRPTIQAVPPLKPLCLFAAPSSPDHPRSIHSQPNTPVIRLPFTLHGPPAMKRSVSQTTTAADQDTPRRRRQPQTSCNFCRSKKLKCDRGQPCANCTTRGISCEGQTSPPPHTLVPRCGAIPTHLMLNTFA